MSEDGAPVTARTPTERAHPMTGRSPTRALADVSATLVEEYDVVSALTHLCVACTDVFGASAAALLVVGDDGAGAGLELLAASSHGAAEVELHQQQVEQGPCLDAVAERRPVHADDADELARRWPRFAAVAAPSGVRSAHAYPLRWRGRALGGLNLFFGTDRRFDAEEEIAAQAFADVATIAIVHARAEPRVEVIAREVQEALDGRTVVEQAKGVIAVQDSVDPAEAFLRLLDRSDARGVSLAALAARVVVHAQRGRRWDDADG
ncbi:GAF and ANTAR domain-containing protein [Cellulomonas cellasea]|uniref:Transcriptional regulator n=1 Tax=Cellulomonas cellasea TaxID=43670 RepID=A0A4Y3KXW4_9CELL|nr:GAF and ANTAR domain-containing protein [Cellulomonas cellasea]GEA88687.1 transcriptional regulator [Cellulomonas cellasea]